MLAKKAVWAVAACLLFAVPVSAQEYVCLAMDGEFYGSLMVGSPVHFSGPITFGSCYPGTWDIWIDDTGWPTDPAPRWDHIWNTFYAPNYDPTLFGGFGGWLGIFDVPTLAERPDLFIDHTGEGTMTGVIQLIFQVQDNGNGVLDPGEECMGSLVGIVIIINDGTGVYAGYCGSGSYSGGFFRDCPGFNETWMVHMDLCIQPCETPVAETTWGTVKALFQ
jgi:hypothetical protein